ncbi:MAG: DUF1311 domain-containing protein [Xanthomonadaceae bacterium]|nr:DUF1311 domain-containing protein [Xanthomonadaceae bacterium]
MLVPEGAGCLLDLDWGKTMNLHENEKWIRQRKRTSLSASRWKASGTKLVLIPLLLGGALLVGLAGTAFAQSGGADGKYYWEGEEVTDEFCKANGGSSLVATVCADRDSARTETELDVVYNRILASLEKGENCTNCAQIREHLVRAQRAWREMADHDCEIVTAAYAGGTLQSAMGADCWSQHVRTRTEQLKESDSFSELFIE